MRKLLTLAVIISLLFGLVPFSNNVERRVAMAAEQNVQAVHLATTFHQVGYNWDNTPLNPPRDFPWQKVGQVCWGRVGYYMPDASKALSTAGLPIPETVVSKATTPMYYTQVYLNVTPNGGVSQESNAYFVVLDSVGQLWFDQDGFYSDSRYNPTTDPIPAQWPFESYPFNGNYIPGSCATDIQGKIDPASDNNTKGPYNFNKYSTTFQPNQYFWDYKKDDKSLATDRMWRLGWADLVDYPFVGALTPNGEPVAAEVTYNAVTGKGDWDYNLPLVPFYQTDATNIAIRYYQEFHTELVADNRYTPGKMTVNGTGERPPEAIYRKKAPYTVIPTIVQVQPGDMRLTAVSKKRLDESKLYPEGTIVTIGDWDIDDIIIKFNDNEKHVDSSYYNGQYDPNEWIYQLPDATVTRVPGSNLAVEPILRTPGAIRLTNVNSKRVETFGSISLALGNGIHTGDALMMTEVLQGGCHTEKYDVTVLTDVYMGDYPSSTAAALRTSNGDLAVAAQRVQKNTVLDPALDKDRYKVLPGTTFHNIQFQYREYAGLEIFLDNGVDNNIGANQPNDILIAQDLSDNLKEERTGEQYIGAKDYESTLDLGRRLVAIPDFYKFHNVNPPTPVPTGYIPTFGCGEAVYYISDTARNVIMAGDRRFTDVDIVNGNVRIKYNRNTIVADGDSDVGLSLDAFYSLDTLSQPGKIIRHDPYKFYYPDFGSITADYTKPFDFDPIYTQIYEDKNESYSVDMGDTRLTEITIDGTTYYCGSPVTGGNNWFMEAPLNMLSVGSNGKYSYIDTEVLPGDVGLTVSVDGKEELMNPATNNGLHSQHLRVEKTSTITVKADPPPKKGEKVYVTLHEPESNEFNIFRLNEWKYRLENNQVDYNFKGKPMNWFGTGDTRAGIWEYELPFAFPYAGNFYNRVYVAEKGFLNLTSKYGFPEGFNAADRRIMVYGDDLSILPPTSPMNITTNTTMAPTFASNLLVNYDKEDIYITNTGDSVTFRWRAQTRYPTVNNNKAFIPYTNPILNILVAPMNRMIGASDYGTYRAANGQYYALIDVQCTLFSDGTVVMNFLKDTPDPNTTPLPVASTYQRMQYVKLLNRVNNVNANASILEAPIIGLAYGSADAANIIGYTSEYMRYPYPYPPNTSSRNVGFKNLAIVDLLIDWLPGNPPNFNISSKVQYSAETWVMELTPFNRPTTQRGILIGSGRNNGPQYDDYDEWKPYEDVRVLTEENPTATFEYTGYRGTARESGIPDWVEIKAFKEQGGSQIAPKDSTYTFIQNLNYADPTVWNSKWIRPEYFRQPWGIFQKTKHFVYPPTERLVPNELKNTYDCFGIARLQVDPAKLDLIPDKKTINPLDERQPLITMQIKNADDPEDVNDPQGMLVSSWRRTVEPVSNIQVDYGVTASWMPTSANSPVGAFFLRINPLYIAVFKVGDYVYIPTQYGAPSQPEYRRITRIITTGTYANTIWFDMPLVNQHTPNVQVVPNPIIGNYNVTGGGIKTMFTTIGGNGQRYIVQVRDDGSYDYWRWFEPYVIGQVIGALDHHDILYSWQTCLTYERNTSQEGPCGYINRAAFPLPNARPPIGLEDMDCTIGQSMNALGTERSEFPKLGEWSLNDRYGVFGNNAETHWNYPNNCAPTAAAYGAIATYGVPVLILPYKTPVTVENLYDDGGKCVIAAWPQDPATPMQIRLYLNTCIFDYNSAYKHPPFFALDTGMGVDYLGEVSIKVGKVNPGLNFTDVAIIDHALQSSKVDYTLGNAGLSKMPPPTPQIASRYNPMLKDLKRDLRAYPGGQSNTGRIVCNLSVPENPPGSHWNAYPAIWENQFVKLGTEFMPMSDYGIAFYLKTVNPYDHYSFLGGGLQGLIRLEIEGPFAFPKVSMEDNTRGTGISADQYLYKMNQRYEYNEYKNLPLDYDFSGKLVIDAGNWFKYERYNSGTSFYSNPFLGFTMMTGPNDFKRVTNPAFPFDLINIPDNEINPWLYFGEKWFYWGVGRYNVYNTGTPVGCPNNWAQQDLWMNNTVFLLDELIPTGAGQITIKVVTADGSEYFYNNCSEDPPLKSLPVHGIRISNAPKTLEIEEDHILELSLTEGTIPEQETENCNSAFVIAWQDRGIMNKATGKLMGMGDGQLANPPRSSVWYKTSSQFPEGFDLNEDGKISFDNFETEVLGAYDLATNTWSSGVVDGRTFMREDGEYKLEFSSNNKNQIVTMGYDFGGIPDESGNFDKKPDHVISEYELIPIYINAYKYGDDNQDRAFTPLWKPFSPNEYSHEVYLAGMTKMMPAPRNELVISYGPDPITAGVTPEIVSADKPLTFTVLDDMGSPINLTQGVPDKNNQTKIITRNVWNLLINDPHPDNKEYFGQDAKLPQYYWVRTDLHNNDSTLYDNNSIYFSTMTPFNPINVDFTGAPQGIYKFFNFCANDAGSFLVRVYTPDRRKYGETTVSVKLPSISYTISNDEDPAKTEYEVPGSPDFVMTSMDKRIYTVTVHVQDAQGDPLRGTAGAQICEGTDDARITITNTFLRNFNPTYRALNNPRYYNLVGIDKNKNGIIEPTNRERINVDGFRGGILYNTSNYVDSRGYYAATPAGDIPPDNTLYMAWGLGCIYNSPYKGGYCFPDMDKDNLLTFNDSISLNQEGEASFKYYANDMGLAESFMGAFIGKNRLTTNPSWNDVAGWPGFNSVLSPNSVYTRFRAGGQRNNGNSIFRLDWDAHPDVFVSIKGPDFRLLDGQTRQPLGKELLNPAYYDLIYGIENYFIVQAFQADSRDLPLKENGIVTFLGGRAEKAIYGVLKNGPDSVPEASIKITPAGTGDSLGFIRYVQMKGGYGEDSDIDVGLSEYSRFDVTNGLGIEVTPLGDLLPKRTISLQIRIQAAGAKNPIDGASVRIVGAGVNEKAKTNKDGLCEIDITPSDEGLITISAEKEGMIKGFASLYIGKDKRPLFIDMDPFPELTNQKMLHISGNTKVNAVVEINGKKMTSNSQGLFAYDMELNEGKNEVITRVTFDTETQETTKVVILDSIAPEVTVSNQGTLVGVKEIALRGKINEQGQVTVNGQTASMIGNDWQLNLSVAYGKNNIEIVAEDMAGNKNSVNRDVYVYQKKLVEVQIGNKVVYVDGVPQSELSVAPFIKNGRTMLPIRIIVESLGAKVDYVAKTKEIVITMDSRVVKMKIGSKEAWVGASSTILDTPPEALQGVTFVPLRFITEAFGFEIEWIQATRTTRIVKLF